MQVLAGGAVGGCWLLASWRPIVVGRTAESKQNIGRAVVVVFF
jgi:hypothetical protein